MTGVQTCALPIYGAAPASSIVVVSGAGQSATAGTQFAPVGVKAVDRFGNVVQYKNFEFSSPVAGVWFGPAQAFAGDPGGGRSPGQQY